ncbi:FtsK/SpoIIIE domain-containing protein [Nocardioides insulae]|uniref:FtsK/SpoIIIE domain-containing protein n=1 Tax=Nocardioides insulae TaxID=394734 RepID=UPI0004012E6A|nr:FtsK/SpoIIIE domain-containing protein [Nocardioides insulae]
MRTTTLRTGAGMRGGKTPQLVTIQPRPTLTAVIVTNLVRITGRLLRWLTEHAAAAGVILVLLLCLVVFGWVSTLAALVGLGCALALWHRRRPDSFRWVVTSRWRAMAIYGRCWQPAMVTCGLATRLGDEEYLPRIRKVRSEVCVDRVLVDLLLGQAPEDFDARTSQLAHTFEAIRCRVVVERPGRIWLEFTHRDPLTETVTALDPEPVPDLTALPIGRTEDGRPWLLRLLGAHLLIAGATGSGKGSVLGSLLRAVGPAIRDGIVRVWAVDPKGGMELSPSAPLFDRFAYGDAAAMVALLEDAVAFMRERAERLRQQGARVHVPTETDPLLLVLVDEMAALTAYVGDRDLKKRADSALQLLLSQGRAAGVLVVAALQDPGKDVLPYRDLFPTRIGLRLLEDVQVDMVLGRSARQHGAECDQIPASLPGVGYVTLEGHREPVRVRAAFVADDDVAATVRDFAPSTTDDQTLRMVKG